MERKHDEYQKYPQIPQQPFTYTDWFQKKNRIIAIKLYKFFPVFVKVVALSHESRCGWFTYNNLTVWALHAETITIPSVLFSTLLYYSIFTMHLLRGCAGVQELNL